MYTTSVEKISSMYPEIVQEGLISLASCSQWDNYDTAQSFRNIPSAIAQETLTCSNFICTDLDVVDSMSCGQMTYLVPLVIVYRIKDSLY